MSTVHGYIVTDINGMVVRDEFGATTLHRDWLAATAQARTQGGGQLIPVLVARPAAESPRRGRPRKQQETGE